MRYGSLERLKTWDDHPRNDMEPVEVEVTFLVDKDVADMFIKALRFGEPIEKLISVEKNSKNGVGEA